MHMLVRANETWGVMGGYGQRENSTVPGKRVTDPHDCGYEKISERERERDGDRERSKERKAKRG